MAQPLQLVNEDPLGYIDIMYGPCLNLFLPGILIPASSANKPW